LSAAPATPGVAWLAINLDRSPERLAELAGRLDALAIDWMRVPAIDGRRLALPLPGIDAGYYRAHHGRELLPDEVGCFLSHLRAMTAFLALPARYAVVLEDDARVTPQAVRLVRTLTAEGAPDDWDLVKLEAHHGAVGLPIRWLAEGARLCALPLRSAGSAAYLVNRVGAAALLDRLLPMRFPYDHAFDRAWDLRIRVRAVLPLPIEAPRATSTISRAGTAARKQAPWQIRAQTKSMRLLAGLAAWASPARPFPARSASAPGAERLFDQVEQAIAGRA